MSQTGPHKTDVHRIALDTMNIVLANLVAWKVILSRCAYEANPTAWRGGGGGGPMMVSYVP